MAAPGLVLADRYRLDGCIAVGGVGEVWRAMDLALERRVAVKLLRPEYAEDDEGLARFRAEARHAGSLSHPNIAHVYDFSGPVPPEPGFLVMEFVDGASLARVLDSGPLDPARTMDIVAQAARGLAAAHRAGVLHRDVKPGNLLAGADGLIKVTDFGIAQAAGTAPVTRTGVLIGTPAYLAPERGAGLSATPAADLYSLGIVAYQCLTGRIPFRGEPLAVIIAHLEQPLPPLPPSVPPAMAALIAELTSKDPLHRPASAIEVARRADRLRAALPGRVLAGPGTAPPARPTARAGSAVPAAGSALPFAERDAAGLQTTAVDLVTAGYSPSGPPAGYQPPGFQPAGFQPAGFQPGRPHRRAGLPTRAGMALAAAGAAVLLGWTVLAPAAAPAAGHALSRPGAARTAPPRSALARQPRHPSRDAPAAQAVPVAATSATSATSATARAKARRQPSPPATPPAAAPAPSAGPSGQPSSTPAPSAAPTPAPSSAAPTPSAPPTAIPTPSVAGRAPSPAGSGRPIGQAAR